MFLKTLLLHKTLLKLILEPRMTFQGIKYCAWHDSANFRTFPDELEGFRVVCKMVLRMFRAAVFGN